MTLNFCRISELLNSPALFETLIFKAGHKNVILLKSLMSIMQFREKMIKPLKSHKDDIFFNGHKT